MYLIKDNSINRYVGITEDNFDVTQISPDFSLEVETPDNMLDFENYKLELAIFDLATLLQSETDKEKIVEIQSDIEDAYEDLNNEGDLADYFNEI